MANTIKLKRGSGSDPGTSDLSVGELAIRTDTALLFTKNDGGSVVPIGISDGDKGDITVSSNGGTFTIDNGVITSAKIADGAIALADMGASSVGTSQLVAGAVTNAKVASDASIALSKLEVITSNRIVGNDSGNAVPKELTAAEVRSIINVEDGATADQSASEIVALIADQTIAPSTIDMEDNEKIKLGAGDDLELFHSGSQSEINSTTGGLVIKDTGGFMRIRSDELKIQSTANENYIECDANGAVQIFHNNAVKFVTSTSGGTITGTLVADGFTGPLTGNVTGNASGSSGSCTGNAATATALETARTIAGVSFDGTSNISLNNNAITNGAGYITATLTNEQVQDIVGGMLTGNTETGITVTYQDGDGTIDFVVGTLNQDTTGNAATATALETARNIGGVSFDGTANINLPGVNTAGNQNTSGTSGGFTAGNASNLNSGTLPDARFPSTLPAVDGSNLTGISAGATGGGSDEIFYENGQNVTTNYTITNGKNAMSAGPITIDSGVTVTVGAGETLTIV